MAALYGWLPYLMPNGISFAFKLSRPYSGWFRLLTSSSLLNHLRELYRQTCEQLLEDLHTVYYDARRHKRNKPYQPHPSTCFIITDSKRREVFAAKLAQLVYGIAVALSLLSSPSSDVLWTTIRLSTWSLSTRDA
ncbi:MAG: hypothetical protein IJK42_06960 [Prevotella sp.]|nr:hypothetical protein [Prevotella sp.]MBQ6209495.1 hypothetical protein [Prevotella sp.]